MIIAISLSYTNSIPLAYAIISTKYYSIVCSNLLDSTVLLIFPNSLTNTIPTIYIYQLGNTSPLVYGPIIQLSNHDINVEMQCDISLNYPFLSAVKKKS